MGWLISTTRPQATTWAVPLDDTHTMQISYYRAPEDMVVCVDARPVADAAMQ